MKNENLSAFFLSAVARISTLVRLNHCFVRAEICGQLKSRIAHREKQKIIQRTKSLSLYPSCVICHRLYAQQRYISSRHQTRKFSPQRER